MNKEQKIRENIAAISARIHGDYRRYERFLEAVSADAGGFPGIWAKCCVLGEIFEDCTDGWVAGEDYEWIDAIEMFSEDVFTYGILHRSLPDQEMKALASNAIRKCRFE